MGIDENKTRNEDVLDQGVPSGEELGLSSAQPLSGSHHFDQSEEGLRRSNTREE